jgi:hypothetical protein
MQLLFQEETVRTMKEPSMATEGAKRGKLMAEKKDDDSSDSIYDGYLVHMFALMGIGTIKGQSCCQGRNVVKRSVSFMA